MDKLGEMEMGACLCGSGRFQLWHVEGHVIDKSCSITFAIPFESKNGSITGM